jgi:hypothetical protein
MSIAAAIINGIQSGKNYLDWWDEETEELVKGEYEIRIIGVRKGNIQYKAVLHFDPTDEAVKCICSIIEAAYEDSDERTKNNVLDNLPMELMEELAKRWNMKEVSGE